MNPKQASDCATARLQGMKLRVEIDPPRAATGGFPYPARTCAEWTRAPKGYAPRHPSKIIMELPDDVDFPARERDAIRGSAKLKAAIEAALSVEKAIAA